MDNIFARYVIMYYIRVTRSIRRNLMDKIGFVGYGSMGSMIIRGILSSNIIAPEDMIISTRSPNKLSKLEKEYPEIEIAPDNVSLADKCQRIFLFVGTGEVRGVIEEIKPKISEDTHIIYISAGLTIEIVESKFKGRITKVIPSLTSKVGEGVSLVCHNKKVTNEDVDFVGAVFRSFGSVKTIEEEDLEVATDLTSCAPAFIAQIFKEFSNAAVRKSNLTQEDAEAMVIKTLYGTVKLIYEGNMGFDEVVSRVATKGGITEEGIKVIQNRTPAMFDELFKVTSQKNKNSKQILNNEWLN